MAILSEAVFAAHGLSQVKFIDGLESLDGIGTRDREERLTGKAMLQPVPEYPLIVEPGLDAKGKQKAGEEWPQEVYFRIALRSNHAAMVHFRRNARIVNAYYKDPEEHGGLHRDPRKVSANTVAASTTPFSPGRLQLMSREGSRVVKKIRPPSQQRRHPLHYSALAWWEDEYGLWYIEKVNEERRIDLTQYWRSLTSTDVEMSRASSPTNVDGSSNPASRPASPGPDRQAARHAMKVYGRACTVLIQLAECLEALGQRQLQLPVCRPEYFRVKQPEDNGAEPEVVLVRATTAVPLPSFSLQGPDVTGSYEDLPEGMQQASSDLDSAASKASHEALFEEALLRKHLRYLAPESVSARRISPVGDIYSFGVLAYELLTGRTTEGSPNTPDQIDVLADVHRHVTAETASPWNLFRHQDIVPDASDLSRIVTPPKALSDIIMRCLAIDVADRYGAWVGVLYDLRRFQQICLNPSADLSKFQAGKVDSMSRFKLPQQLVDRQRESEALDQVFQSMQQAIAAQVSLKRSAQTVFDRKTVQAVTLYGVSGSGKSVMAQRWAATKEAQCLTARAKLDQYLRKPLSSWVQAFHSLLDRVFSDPTQDPNRWRKHLHTALGPTHMSMLLSIISSEWRRALSPESDVQRVEAIDWENFYPAFRVFSAKLINAFVEESKKPLLLLIDDTQWLDREELALWQDLLDDSTPNKIKNVMLICIFRVEGEDPPPPSLVISSLATVIKVHKFDEDAVASFLSQCLHWEARDVTDNDLVAFLYDQTNGNPFYLRSMVSSLVQDGVISFDFDALRWKFDVGLLQDHASEGVDSYLGRVLMRLPLETRRLLALLACLPSIGVDIDLLANLAGVPVRDVSRRLLEASHDTNCVVLSSIGNVRFSHDRQQAASYGLLAAEDRRDVHWKISKFLQQPDIVENFIFEAADNAILALDLGVSQDKPAVLAELMCTAARRAATSAAFTTASMYMDRAERLLNFDLEQTWLDHRNLCFKFAELYAEIAAALRKQDVSVERLRSIIPFAKTEIEKATLTILVVRLLISTSRPGEAASSTLEYLAKIGFDVNAASRDGLPQTAEDVERLRSFLHAEQTSDRSLDALQDKLVLLISFAGLFITQPQVKTFGAFCVAMSLLSSSPALLRNCEAASYMFGAYPIFLEDVSLKIGLTSLAAESVTRNPTSYFASGALVTCFVQAHAWTPFHEIEGSAAFEAASVAANWDVATYVLALDFANFIFSTRSFSSRATQVKLWRDSFIDFVTVPSKVFVDLHLQSIENLITPSSTSEPWLLDGVFVSTAQYSVVQSIPLFSAVWHMMQFRLAMLHEAPQSTLRVLMKAVSDSQGAISGLIYTVEWKFYHSLFLLMLETDESKAELAENVSFLRKFTLSTDCLMRLEVLDAISILQGPNATLLDLGRVDRVLDLLQDHGFNLLCALLSSRVAQWLTARFGGSTRLMSGYLNCAYDSYIRAEAPGLCQNLRQRYPSIFKHTPEISSPLSPGRVFGMHDIAVERPTKSLIMLKNRQHSATSDLTATHSVSGTASTGVEDVLHASGPTTSMEDNLDNLTFMRSSLVIAAERDPDVLVCTLLRILCQYVRADFAAIALTSDPASGSLRLRGAGSAKILPYDLDTSSKAASKVAPIPTMLHVARTRKAITSVHELQKLRSDAFYTEDRMPRAILVLPLNEQGVVVLSSKHPISAAAQVAHLVTSLATFAAIAMTNSTLLQNLERLVDERTRDLTNALQAKTVFMSHITHELRSPLHSVLGLAAVLEDSPGLSSVQREHLQTIRTSGEDLQTIISNILDFSKLESGSVEAESIPFSLRDVAESSLDTVATMAQRKGVEVCLLNAVPEDPDVPIIGDPFRIKQVLLNLLSNAVKFTSKGHVTLRWHIERAPTPDHLKVRLDVEDTGIGILPHKMDRLFRSFSQIDSSITRSYGGSGLGLVISRSLARLLGGDCTATSEYGVGSTFSFTFIAGIEKSAKTKFPTSPVRQSSFVLCGDGPWRRMLHGNLKAFNCNPVTFNDAMSDALTQDYPDGLSGSTKFDFIFIDADLVTKEDIKRAKELQAGAKVYFMVRAMKISEAMRDLNIEHCEILSLPLKANSLCQAVIADKDPSKRGELPLSKGGTRINPKLAKTHPLRILLVDDSNVNLLVGRKILERFGYKDVETASDGQQAVDAADKTKYDLILMDLQMPVLDGVSANKVIQESPLSGQPAVVALTANTDEGTREICTNAGFASYLSKPLSIPLLERCLIKTAESRSIAGTGAPAGFPNGKPETQEKTEEETK